MAKNEIIEIKAIQIEEMQITIRGCGDLILNKMNDPTSRQLIDARKDKAKSTEKPNQWECVITSMHWRDGKPTDFSEEGLRRALIENAPCISAFGLKKSIEETIVRCGLDKYSTKFRSGANIIAPGGLIPIRFAEHHIDEKLMSPKRGAPVLARLNRFSGWSATFMIQYIATSYSAEQIVNLVNAAGFGGGIGSGRSSGYGRYEVAEVTVIRRAE